MPRSAITIGLGIAILASSVGAGVFYAQSTQRRGTTVVLVTDDRGAVRAAFPYALSVNESEMQSDLQVTDDEGRFTIDNAPTGDYVVTMRASDERVLTFAVRVEQGKTMQTLVVP